MADFEQHCRETHIILGNRFETVPRWLDEFFLSPQYGTRHRRLRHHEAGIHEAARLFGPEAGEHALDRHDEDSFTASSTDEFTQEYA